MVRRTLRTLLVPLSLFTASAAPADVVIPSSAFLTGRNSAEFHTDVRVFNPSGTSPVLVTPFFYQSDINGNVVNTVSPPAFVVGPREQVSFDNVLRTLFGQSLGVFGPIRFQTSAAILVSSGTNNVNGCGNGSVSGQSIPGIDSGQALKTGTLVQLAASASGAIGYRSNVDFMNPGNATANVAVKIRRGDGSHLSSGLLSVEPNGLVQRTIDDGNAFPGVAGTTDTNLWLEFTSDQPVIAFASVINNASGDPYAVVMNAEPAAPPAAPVASCTVSANPAPGQAVTFTDTSSNFPTAQLWAFGDGATATSGATVQHAYAAAGTYKIAHFVSNAGGVTGATKDVVVSAVGPMAYFVTAHSESMVGTFNPESVTCKVAVPCRITWTTSGGEVHGLGGLDKFGVEACDDGQPLTAGTPLGGIRASHPCTVTFTPTSYHVDNRGGRWVYFCPQMMGMLGTIVVIP